jgi:hypothetical protein
MVLANQTEDLFSLYSPCILFSKLFCSCFGSRKNDKIVFEIVSYLLFWTSNVFDEVIVEIKLSFLHVGL